MQDVTPELVTYWWTSPRAYTKDRRKTTQKGSPEFDLGWTGTL